MKMPVTVSYRVEVANLQAHLFGVTLTIARPSASQRVSLPAWIPGSYLVREFAKHLQQLTARQATRRLELRQIDKHTWEFDANPDQPLVLQYQVYAYDRSVRTAWLDATRGFFNGTSLCLRVEGQEDQPHVLELVATKIIANWVVATGATALKVNKNGFGTYSAANFDELVDCPVEMGDFWCGEFKACGVPHRFVVAGAAPSFDGARLLADTRKICETEIRFWHGNKKPPHKQYVFMLNVVEDDYGGLEHRNSTALICPRRDLPRLGQSKPPEGYTTLMGLISHEYFHTWNVKRLRPAEFARYDYSQENYTRLLWFFEGFTSYYDDLLLRRAGLLDDAGYLKLLNKTINQVDQTPGRAIQSVAQASFDAWIKYYRQDENTPNATVSYYTKGALVALCLDLTLRFEGKTSLDDVMRGLWQRCHVGLPRSATLPRGQARSPQLGGLTEADIAAVLQDLGGRSFDKEIAAWVHDTGELPLQDLLQRYGVAVMDDPAQLAQRLGLRVSESQGVQVKAVLRGGAAESAGFAAGDEWLGIEVGDLANTGGWRLDKLDDLLLYAGTSKKLTALVSRDKRLMRLSLILPTAVTTRRLSVRDPSLIQKWLGARP